MAEKCAVGRGVVAHLQLDLAQQREVRRRRRDPAESARRRRRAPRRTRAARAARTRAARRSAHCAPCAARATRRASASARCVVGRRRPSRERAARTGSRAASGRSRSARVLGDAPLVEGDIAVAGLGVRGLERGCRSNGRGTRRLRARRASRRADIGPARHASATSTTPTTIVETYTHDVPLRSADRRPRTIRTSPNPSNASRQFRVR